MRARALLALLDEFEPYVQLDLPVEDVGAVGQRHLPVEAPRLTISRGGMTKLVDRLEDAGLLKREPAPDDRRGSFAVLTAAGERMLKRMWPTYAAVLAETISPLKASEANTIRRLLREIERRASGSGT
jgi:DNA-binding MarR family transcriptional regulator